MIVCMQSLENVFVQHVTLLTYMFIVVQLSLHGSCQNSEVFRTRLDRLSHKSKSIASLHYANAPHIMQGILMSDVTHVLWYWYFSNYKTNLLLLVRAGDEVPMRMWFTFHSKAGRVDIASLDSSLHYLDVIWREEGPFDGILGNSNSLFVLSFLSLPDIVLLILIWLIYRVFQWR